MAYSRRSLLKITGIAGTALAGTLLEPRGAWPQVRATPTEQSIQTPVLNIGYEESGNPRGFPIILLHGFPDDVHAWDDVAPPLASDGFRVLAPYLRGYGPTRFRDATAPRMAEQAAIGQDVIDFADALHLPRFALCGYDWGGRAACIAAALFPERVRAAVIIGGYTIQDSFNTSRPASPEMERALWYQWYFNTERGRAGLQTNRRALCRYLWELWSPGWHFSNETFDRTAASFDNPDFVDLVIHSYRHRNGGAPGDPRFLSMEQQLALRPKIKVPSTVLRGATDGVNKPPADLSVDRNGFTSLVASRVIEGAGHFLPREKPNEVSSAIQEVLATAR